MRGSSYTGVSGRASCPPSCLDHRRAVGPAEGGVGGYNQAHMAGVRAVNPVGQFETRPEGLRAVRTDHPVNVGPPAVVTPISLQTGPPAGAVAVATPLRLTAQVRDGVAMFGTGAVSVTGTPLMGAGTPSALAQTTAAARKVGVSGIASQ